MSEIRLRGHVDVEHLDHDDVAGLDDLARVARRSVFDSADTWARPSWWTPMSMKAPKAATLVTTPSSVMPGLRSLDLLDALLEGGRLERRPRVAAGLVELG